MFPNRHLPIVSIVTALLLLLSGMTGCDVEPTFYTVDGPEAQNLIVGASGFIVTNDNGDITAISLPDQKMHTVIRPKASPTDGPTIHALSGPDREGRIAYIEDHYFVQNKKQERHLLKTVRIDGAGDTELFTRSGNAMWATSAVGNGEIGHCLAIAPKGGRIAFISRIGSKQMPGALFSVGQIEIWNIDAHTNEQIATAAIDDDFRCTLSWFPDGQRLAYTRFVARKDLSQSANGLKYFRTYFGQTWDEIPAVFIYDVNSHQSTFFSVGWRPLVACDGNYLLIGGWNDRDYRWLRADATNGKLTPINLPGSSGDVLGTTANGLILYLGLPTTGTPLKSTKNNSPLRGPKPMLTIKITDSQGKQFQTVVPYIDPRSQANFGKTYAKVDNH